MDQPDERPRRRALATLDPPRRRSLVALAALVVLPFAVAALQAHQGGWYPVGDDATLARGARQVLSTHPPLVGEITSSQKFGVTSYHPGPLVLQVYAPFVQVLGSTWGMLVAAAALSSASLLLIGRCALRTSGPRAALVALLTALAMACSLGGTAYLYRPFKTVATVLPILLLLHLCTAVVVRRWRVLPLWAAVASLVAASSAQHLVLVGGLVTTSLGAALAGRRRARGDAARPGWRAWIGRPEVRRTLALTAGVLIVSWWGPIVDVLTHRGGNAVDLVRAARAASGSTVGLVAATGDVARGVVLDPAMTTSAQAASSAVHVAASAALVVAVLATIARRRHDLPPDVLAAAGVAGTALALVTVGVATSPGDEGFGYYRIIATAPVGAFALYAAARVLLAVTIDETSPARAARLDRLLALGVVALVALVAVPGPLDDRTENLPWTYGAVHGLVGQLTDDGRLEAELVEVRMAGPRSALLVLIGVVSGIEDGGVATTFATLPSWGDGAPDRGPPTYQLLVLPMVLPAPGPDWTLLATSTVAGRDDAAALATATELARAVAADPPGLLPLASDALPGLLCPATRFDPTVGCPAAERIADVADLPPEVLALAYTEQFGLDYAIPLLDGAEEPDDLDALRAGWEALPYGVWGRPAP